MSTRNSSYPINYFFPPLTVYLYSVPFTHQKRSDYFKFEMLRVYLLFCIHPTVPQEKQGQKCKAMAMDFQTNIHPHH